MKLDNNMKRKTIGLTLALSVAAAAVCFANNPTLGTWKLNESKSTFGAGAGKSTMVVWEKANGQQKCTVDGTDGDGKKVHTVWSGKLDGKDYPITGDATSDMRSFQLNGKDTIDMVSKKDGKTVGEGKIVVEDENAHRWQAT